MLHVLGTAHTHARSRAHTHTHTRARTHTRPKYQSAFDFGTYIVLTDSAVLEIMSDLLSLIFCSYLSDRFMCALISPVSFHSEIY